MKLYKVIFAIVLTLYTFLHLTDPQIDESVVEQLTCMGFPVNGCRRAVAKTGNNGECF